MSTEQTTVPTPPARDERGRRIGAWVIGHNVAGYLPEADTTSFVDWTDAWIALWDMAREYADADDEQGDESRDPADYDSETEYDADAGSMRATVDSMSTDAALTPTVDGSEWSMWAADYNDRSIVFWLHRDDELVADDAEDEYDATAIMSVWSSYGHEFMGTGEYEYGDESGDERRYRGVYVSCLTCGAEYVLRATPDAFSDGDYFTSGGDRPADCTSGDMCHGECHCETDEQREDTARHACPCVLCSG